MNKLAKVFVLLVKHDHLDSQSPRQWPSAFKDLTQLLMGADRTLYLQFWVKVLLTFDEEVVESSHNKLPLELQNSSLIKQ